ncbi:SMC-Scp complex subunit ScpB [Candidatus Parcubacteria bacterium]|nr:MAG: SMC-Scp complex subunit ScpB [Candidatus Parcubacteria bacterium]
MSSLKSKIESLLFISAKPMSARQLAEIFKKDESDVKAAGDSLVNIYKEDKRGIQIIKNGSKYQMVSSPENTKYVQEFIKDETTGELSRPSLETLTIIAYKGPIPKLDLDRIRGVNCSLILRNLLLRGLVEVKEDRDNGESIYNVSLDFLRFLGISSVEELPDYEKLNQDEIIDDVLNPDQKKEESSGPEEVREKTEEAKKE